LSFLNAARAGDLKVTVRNDFIIPCPIDQLPCSAHECEEIRIKVKNNETRVYEKTIVNENGASVWERQYTPEGRYFWKPEEKGVLVKNAVIQDEGIFSCLLRFRKNKNNEES